MIKLRPHDKHSYVIIWSEDYLSWMKFFRRKVWMPSIRSLWQCYMKMGNTTGHKGWIKTKLKNFRVKAGNMWMRTNSRKPNRIWYQKLISHKRYWQKCNLNYSVSSNMFTHFSPCQITTKWLCFFRSPLPSSLNMRPEYLSSSTIIHST